MNGKIPGSSLIDQETINLHESFYKCYKSGPEFLFGKLRIREGTLETNNISLKN